MARSSSLSFTSTTVVVRVEKGIRGAAPSSPTTVLPSLSTLQSTLPLLALDDFVSTFIRESKVSTASTASRSVFAAAECSPTSSTGDGRNGTSCEVDWAVRKKAVEKKCRSRPLEPGVRS